MSDCPSCWICSVRLKTQHPSCATTRRSGRLHVRLDLIPQALHGALVQAGLYTPQECRNAHVPACYICNEAVSGYFTDAERARYLTNPRILKQAMDKIGWIKLRQARKGPHSFGLTKLATFDWNTEEAVAYKRIYMSSDLEGELLNETNEGENTMLSESATQISGSCITRGDLLAVVDAIFARQSRNGENGDLDARLASIDTTLANLEQGQAECRDDSKKTKGVVKQIKNRTTAYHDEAKQARLEDARLRSEHEERLAKLERQIARVRPPSPESPTIHVNSEEIS